MKPAITHERLVEVLNYDPATGVFTWRTKPNRRIRAGSVAGTPEKGGHLRIGIDGTDYMAHRLAVFYVTGKMPELTVDHRNGIGDDNRFDNLREVTHAINTQNIRKPMKTNTSGFLGVWFQKNAKKWAASISVKNRNKFIGLFPTAAEAHEAYVNAKRKYHEGCTL